MLSIGCVVPNFEGPTTMGTLIDMYEHFDKSWGLIISHPMDFGPICTTELSRLTQINKDLMKRRVKVIIISTRRDEKHEEWIGDVCKYSNCFVPFPRINDNDGRISEKLGLIDSMRQELTSSRTTLILAPDKRLAASISYPRTVGRNFYELLRLIDALQLTDDHPELVTPADWRPGESVLVESGHRVAGETVVELPSGRDYLRFASDPKHSKKD